MDFEITIQRSIDQSKSMLRVLRDGGCVILSPIFANHCPVDEAVISRGWPRIASLGYYGILIRCIPIPVLYNIWPEILIIICRCRPINHDRSQDAITISFKFRLVA